LLAAARELFLRYGYRSVSSRQIAAAAGANVAMIRYYFGGKPGLYREICHGVIQPVRARIDAMTEGNASVELGALLGTAMRMWAANQWLPGLIVREVLMPDGPLQSMFVREFPERLVPLVEKIVRMQMERGRIRPDLDPKLVVLSMISLGLFPFLALPVTSRVFGVRQDEEFMQRLVRHTTELLAHGFAVPEVPERKS
jgi:AcrR family transcriptional regulator